MYKSSWHFQLSYLLFSILGSSFVTFANGTLILMDKLDRENLINGHDMQVILQCFLRATEQKRILKRFTQKVFIIVEDIDDHNLFPSNNALLIVNENASTKVK